MSLPGGPTKEEIMAVSLAKLSLQSSDIVADIGCGTGTVAVEIARRVTKVYAVDLREEAVVCTRDLARACGITNLDVSLGHGADLVKGLSHIDAAFIGGSRDLSRVLSLLSEKRVRSVVVNAVLLSTLHEAVTAMQELSMFSEVVHVSVSRSAPLAGGLLLKPLDPVYIIVGGCRC
jgi:cobalt-precorrin-6B (C15)-methyltransferase